MSDTYPFELLTYRVDGRAACINLIPVIWTSILRQLRAGQRGRCYLLHSDWFKTLGRLMVPLSAS